MTTCNHTRVLFSAFLCCGAALLGCKRETNMSVARWVHYRALDSAETNGVYWARVTNVDMSEKLNARVERMMSAEEREETMPRLSNVRFELESFVTPERLKALTDDFMAKREFPECRREEVVSALASVRYFVLMGVAPLVMVEVRSPRADVALAVLEYWAAAFQKTVNDRYAYKYELTIKWVEAMCKKAEIRGDRDVDRLRQCYMSGIKEMPRTLRQLRFYTVEPPHIVAQ